MSTKFTPISEEGSLSERIVSQISDALVKGDINYGDRLPPERELAEQFGVSRTVVRDAVKTLAGRGIVQVRHGAGIFVTSVEDKINDGARALSGMLVLEGAGLQELFEIRKVLEVEGAYWAAQRRSSHHVERLRGILDDAYRHKGEPEVLSERDAQFHVAIAKASQNLVHVRVMLTLLDLLESARKESLDIAGRPELSLDEHYTILQAIELRNTAATRNAMLKHLNSVERTILSPDGIAQQNMGNAI